MQAYRCLEEAMPQVNFPLCLAPMVGLSHRALRQVIQSYMPEGAVTIWPTEMLSSWKLPKEDLSLTPETLKGNDETELIPQILGNEEDPIRQSIIKLADWGAAGIDINMGCPVQKALKHNYGVALMGDINYAAEVTSMAVRASKSLPIKKIPVSVKLRAGPQGDFNFLLNFAKALESAGASWLTLHPRTAEQKRRGRADWDQIRELKKHINIPVIGNGDIQTKDCVLSMLERTSCDMVMSGRALAARPWMVWQLGEQLGFQEPKLRLGERAPQGPEAEAKEYGKSLNFLWQLLSESHNENLALRKFRFHIRMTCGWLDFGHTLFSVVNLAKNSEEMRVALGKFFSQDLQMYPRTELRE